MSILTHHFERKPLFFLQAHSFAAFLEKNPYLLRTRQSVAL